MITATKISRIETRNKGLMGESVNEVQIPVIWLHRALPTVSTFVPRKDSYKHPNGTYPEKIRINTLTVHKL